MDRKIYLLHEFLPYWDMTYLSGNLRMEARKNREDNF